VLFYSLGTAQGSYKMDIYNLALFTDGLHHLLCKFL